MLDTALLVQCGHRLRPCSLALGRMHRAERHQRINLADHSFHHRPALVDLCHQPLGAVTLHCGHGRLGPIERTCRRYRRILDHIGPPILRWALHRHPHHHDPAIVGPVMPRDRRINRHNNPVHHRQNLDQSRINHRPRPQPARHIGQHDAVQFLPTQPGPGIAGADFLQKTIRQIGAVRLGRRMGPDRTCAGQQVLQHRGIARGRGHTDLRAGAQPQPELQHIPGLLPLAPLAQLIRPGRIKLRPAQCLGFKRRIHRRLGAIRPDQLFAARNPLRAAIRGRTGQYPTLAKHHHLAGLLNRLTDQSHPPGTAGIARPRPFHH